MGSCGARRGKAFSDETEWAISEMTMVFAGQLRQLADRIEEKPIRTDIEALDFLAALDELKTHGQDTRGRIIEMTEGSPSGRSVAAPGELSATAH